MSVFFGTVSGVVKDDQGTGLKLNVITQNGKLSYTSLPAFVLKAKPELLRQIKGLKPNDKIKMLKEKNEKGFDNLVNVEVVAEFPEPKTATKGFNQPFGSTNTTNSSYKPYDATGPIKGNVVTNAITLAIARKGTSLEDLKKASIDVLALHKHLEALDIATLLKSTVEGTETPKAVDIEEELDLSSFADPAKSMI